MKNTFKLIIITLVMSVLSFSQTTKTPVQPQLIPNNNESLQLCLASVKTSRFESALTDCTNAIKESPTRFEGYQGRGIANFSLKNNDAALSDFTKAIQLAPNNFQLFGLRGEFYVSTQKYDLAIADFNKVLQLSPNHQIALYRRANINAQTGKKDLAIADLKAILAVNPNQPEAKKKLAELESTPEKQQFYRSDKYKIAFQIPNDSIQKLMDSAVIFEGDTNKYGKRSLLIFAVQESSEEALAQSQLLLTDAGIETLADAYRPLGATNYALKVKSRQKISNFNALAMTFTEDDLTVFGVYPRPQIVSVMLVIPVPEHKRVYKFLTTASYAGDFKKWLTEGITSAESFKVLLAESK